MVCTPLATPPAGTGIGAGATVAWASRPSASSRVTRPLATISSRSFVESTVWAKAGWAASRLRPAAQAIRAGLRRFGRFITIIPREVRRRFGRSVRYA
ncbi:hypothetical protein D3C80_1793670 [compost metagenome]